MKNLETAKIVAFSAGTVLMIYNLAMAVNINSFFVETDLISSTIGFASLAVITYMFYILKKLLNTHLKNNSADKLLTWTVRLFIAIGILQLYIIFSMVTMLFREAAELIVEPSSIFGSIFKMLMNFVLLIGLSLALGLVLIFLGNKLRKIKTNNEHLFLTIGLTVAILGIVGLLTNFQIIDNQFIYSIVEAATIIFMGIIFKKYEHLSPMLINDESLPVEISKQVPIIEDELTDELNQEDTESTDKNDENDLDKEDPSRFMPK
ncbi:hypothetical protein [Maribacter sp. 2304DJ31-5]|uniref:hypothetical protein n=1 Tax=Maribacter sp. 2304DJ31-5 TaxID=3386273 RepID=UPI0039BD3002